jgi:hypothetical protein
MGMTCHPLRLKSHVVFYDGECVRSRFRGLGEVIATGRHPVMLFIDGPELHVPGHTPSVVPRHVYDAEVENRRRIERYLDWRLYGLLNPDIRPLPPPPFDLEAAMTSPRLPFDAPCSRPVDDAGLCFIIADLRVSGGDDPPLPVDPWPVRVVARKVPDRNCRAGCGCPSP